MSETLAEFSTPIESLDKPLVGHDAAVATLDAAIASDRLHHAILLSGPCGIGKATLAWKLAARLLSEGVDAELTKRQILSGGHPDLSALVAEGNGPGEAGSKAITVDQVRALIRRLSHSSGRTRRIALIDSVDALNANAANALLKSLEEPPGGVVFLLVAHAAGRLPATIRSRCLRVRLERLSPDDMALALAALGVTANDAILNVADGRPGHAVAMADAGQGDEIAALRKLLSGRAAPATPKALQQLAGDIGRRGNDSVYAAAIETWFAELRAGLNERIDAESDPRTLAELPELWNNSSALIRETDTFNLDRVRLIEMLLDMRPRRLRTGHTSTQDTP